MIKSCNFYIINKYKPPTSFVEIFPNYGGKIWLDENRKFHRDFDLPSTVFPFRTFPEVRSWQKHGKFHRVNPKTNELDLNFPARIYSNSDPFYCGDKKYYKNGIQYNKITILLILFFQKLKLFYNRIEKIY